MDGRGILEPIGPGKAALVRLSDFNQKYVCFVLNLGHYDLDEASRFTLGWGRTGYFGIKRPHRFGKCFTGGYPMVVVWAAGRRDEHLSRDRGHGERAYVGGTSRQIR